MARISGAGPKPDRVAAPIILSVQIRSADGECTFRPMYFGPMGKVAGMRNMEPWKDRRKRKRVMNYLVKSREPRNGR